MDESKETQMRDSPLPLSLSVVLDNIDTGIAIYDAKGNFVFINTVMVNWRNIPRNEYLTMNIHDFPTIWTSVSLTWSWRKAACQPSAVLSGYSIHFRPGTNAHCDGDAHL